MRTSLVPYRAGETDGGLSMNTSRALFNHAHLQKYLTPFLLLALLANCTSESSEPDTVTISGTVTDAVSGSPLRGAEVTDGNDSVSSDSDGTFAIEVQTEASLSVSRCGYEGDSGISTKKTLEIQMTPIETHMTVIGNLTRKPIKGVAKGPNGNVKAGARGALTLLGVCPKGNWTVQAPGYETKKVMPSEGRMVKLQADPATTLKQMGKWEAQQHWIKSSRLIHPDALAYITPAQDSAVSQEDATNGYQTVRYEVRKVHFVTWTLPACSVGNFGPKTYRRTAAIEHVYVGSTPQGGIERVPGVIHLVQTKDGVWRHFPTLGCDFEI